MIVLKIRARDVDAIMDQGYDIIRVYRDVSQGGTFVTRIADIPLVAGQEYYEYADPAGDVTNYYEFSYYRSATNAETAKSPPFSPSPVTGPLNLLTVDYVWATTDFPAVADLPASKIGELIVRAETELMNYANSFGGFVSSTAAGWASIMPIVARMVLEEIYLRGRPSVRSRAAGGLASERIGNYSYTTRSTASANTGYIGNLSPEIINLLAPFLAGMIRETTIKTTVVFPEVNPVETVLTPQSPGIEKVPYQDYLDKDFYTFDLYFPGNRIAANGVALNGGPPSWWDN